MITDYFYKTYYSDLPYDFVQAKLQMPEVYNKALSFVKDNYYPEMDNMQFVNTVQSKIPDGHPEKEKVNNLYNKYKKETLGLPLKSANATVMNTGYDQPMVEKTILPDPNRPKLLPEVNATEYKRTFSTDNGEVTVPSIVNGQFLDKQNTLTQYRHTGEKFKDMTDQRSYSNFYDEINNLGLMQNP